MNVVASIKSRPSGRALDAALSRVGYDGPPINFGYSGCRYAEGMVNPPKAVALASNKRLALQAMTAAGVPTLYLDHTQVPVIPFPVVARPDHHHAGRFYRLCHTQRELDWAMRPRVGRGRKARCTHIQRYLEGAREFRVHIVAGQSIKISGKVGGGNHRTGAVFAYPHDFGHKITLRDVSKAAVASLGLDFGAVDVLYRDGQFYVLEVNTAPGLTDPTSDTLARYVRAFREEWSD